MLRPDSMRPRVAFYHTPRHSELLDAQTKTLQVP